MNLLPSMDIVRRSIALYKENKDLFASYLKLLFLPSVTLIVLGALADFLTHESRVNQNQLVLNIGGAVYFILIVGLSIASLWMSIAFLRTIADRYVGINGRPPKETFPEAIALIWPAIIASILSGLAVIGGFILLIIPGIIFSIWFAFTMQAVVIDNKRGVAALSYSKSLVKGRWWSTLIRLIVPGFLFGILIIAVSGIAEVILTGLLDNIPDGSVASLLITIIVGLFTAGIAVLLSPLPTAAQTILYIELKKTPVVKQEQLPTEPA